MGALKGIFRGSLNFFNQYTCLKDFKKDYDCVCETFVDMHDDDYVIDTDYEGRNWAEHILFHPEKKYKAAIYKESVLYHFALNVNLTQFEDEKKPYIIVTLTDITQEIEQKNRLEELKNSLELMVDFKTKELRNLNQSLEKRVRHEIQQSQQKDRILFQQNKMASMGEMLSNIAHQWRQPLTAISTAASSLKLQKELKILNNKEVDNSCNLILKNTQYLSQTIEDFKNFFITDKEKTYFLIAPTINETIYLLTAKLKYENIEIVLEISHDFTIYGYKNEFQQALLNLLHNCIDAFKLQNITHNRFIFISTQENTLFIKDNAHGIDEKILDKIFEPYFTTKHQSQGTGIGLYMTQEILVTHMNCTIDVQNVSFSYKKQPYNGVEFSITFPH